MADTAPVAESADSAVPTTGGRVTDRVQLSEAARLRQRLKSEIDDLNQGTSDRVQALQADVAHQTYAPSPRAIAERLLGELAADLLA